MNKHAQKSVCAQHLLISELEIQLLRQFLRNKSWKYRQNSSVTLYQITYIQEKALEYLSGYWKH